MHRYIDADAIKYRCLPMPAIGDFFATKADIDAMPTADVREVKHAYWRRIELFRDLDGKNFTGVECSNCYNRLSEESFDDPMDFEFCPHCGARMDGGTEK